jgi:hypothetical protein
MLGEQRRGEEAEQGEDDGQIHGVSPKLPPPWRAGRVSGRQGLQPGVANTAALLGFERLGHAMGEMVALHGTNAPFRGSEARNPGAWQASSSVQAWRKFCPRPSAAAM